MITNPLSNTPTTQAILDAVRNGLNTVPNVDYEFEDLILNGLLETYKQAFDKWRGAIEAAQTTLADATAKFGANSPEGAAAKAELEGAWKHLHDEGDDLAVVTANESAFMSRRTGVRIGLKCAQLVRLGKGGFLPALPEEPELMDDEEADAMIIALINRHHWGFAKGPKAKSAVGAITQEDDEA